jgi:hypothetical protein
MTYAVVCGVHVQHNREVFAIYNKEITNKQGETWMDGRALGYRTWYFTSTKDAMKGEETRVREKGVVHAHLRCK